jgi:hypothetical protein
MMLVLLAALSACKRGGRTESDGERLASGMLPKSKGDPLLPAHDSDFQRVAGLRMIAALGG